MEVNRNGADAGQHKTDHFDYSRLIRFVLPCIGTMLFTSIYGIVDGLCVSNFVGKTAFAAVNLIMPVPMLVGTVGFMLGTGGSAIVGITLGEGDKARADRYFSLFMSTALIAGIVLSVVGMLLLRPVALMLGAEGEMLDYALRYGRVLMLSLPTFILQNMFQSFFVTAEKPHLGFYFTVGAGCTNSFTITEARRIKQFLGLPEHAGLEGLAKALQLRFYANINNDEIILGKDNETLVYRTLECHVQTARKRKQMEYHPCKSVGIIEYSGFAKTIDERITCECLSCYPDITDNSCCCVDTLAEETMVAECYRKWQECQNEVYRAYKDTLPEYPPLSGQKEFKSIKNMVISEAVKLGNGSFYFDDARYEQSENHTGVDAAQQTGGEAVPDIAEMQEMMEQEIGEQEPSAIRN